MFASAGANGALSKSPPERLARLPSPDAMVPKGSGGIEQNVATGTLIRESCAEPCASICQVDFSALTGRVKETAQH